MKVFLLFSFLLAKTVTLCCFSLMHVTDSFRFEEKFEPLSDIPPCHESLSKKKSPQSVSDFSLDIGSHKICDSCLISGASWAQPFVVTEALKFIHLHLIDNTLLSLFSPTLCVSQQSIPSSFKSPPSLSKIFFAHLVPQKSVVLII